MSWIPEEGTATGPERIRDHSKNSNVEVDHDGVIGAMCMSLAYVAIFRFFYRSQL